LVLLKCKTGRRDPMGHARHLNIEEARRAIYIDFEGNTGQAPSLLGIRVEETTEQVILEPALESYGALTNARYATRVDSLDSALLELKDRSIREGRLILGFSIHEVQVVSAYCADPRLVEWFESAYVNAKKPIDRWIRRQAAEADAEKPEERSLVEYMKFVDVQYAPGTGSGIVGPGLTRLRQQIGRYGSAEATTKGARLHWWRILSHNSTDLTATRELTLRAATA
jgi:hypothetical protein